MLFKSLHFEWIIFVIKCPEHSALKQRWKWTWRFWCSPDICFQGHQLRFQYMVWKHMTNSASAFTLKRGEHIVEFKCTREQTREKQTQFLLFYLLDFSRKKCEANQLSGIKHLVPILIVVIKHLIGIVSGENFDVWDMIPECIKEKVGLIIGWFIELISDKV